MCGRIVEILKETQVWLAVQPNSFLWIENLKYLKINKQLLSWSRNLALF